VTKRILSLSVLALLVLPAFTLAVRAKTTTATIPMRWTGYIADPVCGDPFTLYNQAQDKNWVLDGADLAASQHIGQTVIVTGKLEGDTIHVDSIR
jgi:hypothetical protein